MTECDAIFAGDDGASSTSRQEHAARSKDVLVVLMVVTKSLAHVMGLGHIRKRAREIERFIAYINIYTCQGFQRGGEVIWLAAVMCECWWHSVDTRNLRRKL